MLNWRKRFQNQDTTCQLCQDEEETLEHFLIRCRILIDVKKEMGLDKCRIEDLLVLTNNLNIDIAKRGLTKMYKHRNNIIKQL